MVPGSRADTFITAVLSGLKGQRVGFTPGERTALVIAEVAVVASSVLLPVSSGTDWQTGLVVFGLVFAFLQGLVVLIVAIIASRRRRGAQMMQSTSKTEIKNGLTRAGKKVGGIVQQILGWLFIIAFLYAIGGHVAEWMYPASDWATKWRYSLDTDLQGADYALDKRPHDCEFMSAPMGDKHCHYEKEVVTVRVRNNAGRREASYDEGKTWLPAEPGVRRTVLVSWRKVQD